MTFNIYTRSIHTILMRMEASTAHLYYAAELASTTGQTAPTVYRALNALTEARIIYGTAEIVPENEFRRLRIKYEYTPLGLSFVRMERMSST